MGNAGSRTQVEQGLRDLLKDGVARTPRDLTGLLSARMSFVPSVDAAVRRCPDLSTLDDGRVMLLPTLIDRSALLVHISTRGRVRGSDIALLRRRYQSWPRLPVRLDGGPMSVHADRTREAGRRGGLQVVDLVRRSGEWVIPALDRGRPPERRAAGERWVVLAGPEGIRLRPGTVDQHAQDWVASLARALASPSVLACPTEEIHLMVLHRAHPVIGDRPVALGSVRRIMARALRGQAPARRRQASWSMPA